MTTAVFVQRFSGANHESIVVNNYPPCTPAQAFALAGAFAASQSIEQLSNGKRAFHTVLFQQYTILARVIRQVKQDAVVVAVATLNSRPLSSQCEALLDRLESLLGSLMAEGQSSAGGTMDSELVNVRKKRIELTLAVEELLAVDAGLAYDDGGAVDGSGHTVDTKEKRERVASELVRTAVRREARSHTAIMANQVHQLVSSVSSRSADTRQHGQLTADQHSNLVSRDMVQAIEFTIPQSAVFKKVSAQDRMTSKQWGCQHDPSSILNVLERGAKDSARSVQRTLPSASPPSGARRKVVSTSSPVGTMSPSPLPTVSDTSFTEALFGSPGTLPNARHVRESPLFTETESADRAGFQRTPVAAPAKPAANAAVDEPVEQRTALPETLPAPTAEKQAKQQPVSDDLLESLFGMPSTQAAPVSVQKNDINDWFSAPSDATNAPTTSMFDDDFGAALSAPTPAVQPANAAVSFSEILNARMTDGRAVEWSMMAEVELACAEHGSWKEDSTGTVVCTVGVANPQRRVEISKIMASSKTCVARQLNTSSWECQISKWNSGDTVPLVKCLYSATENRPLPVTVSFQFKLSGESSNQMDILIKYECHIENVTKFSMLLPIGRPISSIKSIPNPQHSEQGHRLLWRLGNEPSGKIMCRLSLSEQCSPDALKDLQLLVHLEANDNLARCNLEGSSLSSATTHPINITGTSRRFKSGRLVVVPH